MSSTHCALNGLDVLLLVAFVVIAPRVLRWGYRRSGVRPMRKPVYVVAQTRSGYPESVWYWTGRSFSESLVDARGYGTEAEALAEAKRLAPAGTRVEALLFPQPEGVCVTTA